MPIWIQKYGDASIRSLAVEASYDGGKSWHDLEVRRVGQDWSTRIRNPAAGFVSLRARATDTDGNAVRQTIIHVYAVKTRR